MGLIRKATTGLVLALLTGTAFAAQQSCTSSAQGTEASCTVTVSGQTCTVKAAYMELDSSGATGTYASEYCEISGPRTFYHVVLSTNPSRESDTQQLNLGSGFVGDGVGDGIVIYCNNFGLDVANVAMVLSCS